MKGLGKPKRGFWRRMLAVALPILGGLIGGPIGAGIGTLLGTLLFADENDAENDAENGSGLSAVGVESIEELPMTDVESLNLEKWFSKIFFPTLVSLANKIDATINITANKGNTADVKSAIYKANEVLKEIATIRAYNVMIRSYSEINSSKNYSINKANYTEYWLNALEKIVLKYVEDNIQNQPNIVLVKSEFIASDIKGVEIIKLNWQSKKIASQYKKYILSKSQINSNDTQIEVTNTDTTSSNSSTDGEGEEVAELPTTPNNNNKQLPNWIVNVLATIGLVYVGKKILEKKKGFTNNQKNKLKQPNKIKNYV